MSVQVPLPVCHDEMVVECDANQAAAAKDGLQGVMIEAMHKVLSGMDEGLVPVQVGGRIARSWEKEISLMFTSRVLWRASRDG